MAHTSRDERVFKDAIIKLLDLTQQLSGNNPRQGVVLLLTAAATLAPDLTRYLDAAERAMKEEQ